MTELSIVALDSAVFGYAPQTWPFSETRRAEIDAHFSLRRRDAPEIWNGQVLLLRDYTLAARHLSGTFFQTDYASYTAWDDWGFPDRSVTNCFAMAAIRSADGAFLLGEMASHTAKAGLVYFPAGTPEPDDIVGDTVDLARSVTREVGEETGLSVEDLAVEAGWSAVFSPGRIALMKSMRSPMAAGPLRARILDHLARERQPELADMRIVRHSGDFTAAMPNFVRAYLAHRLAE